jgi:sugar lactone lactonase YvrE
MTDAWRVHDEAACLLGEGALWHPERGELFWFDILGRALHAQGRRWSLPELSSAAGWIDRDTLLIAEGKRLSRFDLATGVRETTAAVDEGNPLTRFNDGRADPWGGFWISTMGIGTEKEAGAIWRYFRGEVRRLIAPVTIPNAICFSPDGRACFADTDRQIVWCQPLTERDGWPRGEAETFLDFRGTDLRPDGAVFDAAGTIWIAFWGAGKVAGYRADGTQAGEFACPAKQTTCPAFGGEDLSTLFCTSAAAAIPQAEVARNPGQGRTSAWDAGIRGVAEPRVLL